MKRHREGSELEQLQAENDRLKDKIKICMLERNFLQKRLESGEIEQQLSLERSKQRLAEVENEKLLLKLECDRLRGLKGEMVERRSLVRSKPVPILPATREPALMLSDYNLNHFARLKPSSVNHKLNDHNTNYIPVRNSSILTAKQAAEFLQLDWGEGRQHALDARYSTDKISERTRGKRKSELRKSRDVKIEPRVVCRDAMTSPPLLEHFNGSQPRKSRRKVKAKTPSKKSLVLTALKNLGGEGTIDDVDKWVKKNNPPGYGKVDRRSVSNALYKLAVEKKLEVLDKKKNTIWNVYRVRRKTPEKKGLISGKSMKKKERFNVLMEGTGVDRTSKEKKDFRKRSNAQVAAMQIPNDKSSSSKIHALPLRVGGCEFTDPNYAFGGSVGVISTDKDRKHHL